MQVENHKEEAPFAHYAELFRNLNPAAVTARLSDVRWDGKEFTLSLLGRALPLPTRTMPSARWTAGRCRRCPPRRFCCAICWKAKMWSGRGSGRPSGRCLGEMYIKPYTGRVLTRAAFTFGTRLRRSGLPAKNAGAAHEARRRGLSVRPDRRLSDADSRLGRG